MLRFKKVVHFLSFEAGGAFTKEDRENDRGRVSSEMSVKPLPLIVNEIQREFRVEKYLPLDQQDNHTTTGQTQHIGSGAAGHTQAESTSLARPVGEYANLQLRRCEFELQM